MKLLLKEDRSLVGRCNFLPHKYKCPVSLGLNVTGPFFFTQFLMNLKDEVIEFDVDGTLCLISYFTTSQACLFGVDDQCVVIAVCFSDKGPFLLVLPNKPGPSVTESSALSSTVSPRLFWRDYNSDIKIC